MGYYEITKCGSSLCLQNFLPDFHATLEALQKSIGGALTLQVGWVLDQTRPKPCQHNKKPKTTFSHDFHTTLVAILVIRTYLSKKQMLCGFGPSVPLWWTCWLRPGAVRSKSHQPILLVSLFEVINPEFRQRTVPILHVSPPLADARSLSV